MQKLYTLIILSVLLLAIPTIFLRGGFHQNTATQIDGLSRLSSLQSVSLGPVIWSEPFNNPSAWSISGNSPAALQVNDSLTLNVVFPTKTTAQAVLISRGLNISLDQEPVLSLAIKVSGGVGYGVRFWGVTAGNKSFTAWKEGSSLQHRPGLGIYENVLANLVNEARRASPNLPLQGSRITQLTLYLEVVPLVSGTFSMTVSDLRVNDVVMQKVTSTEISGNMGVLIADLGPTITIQGLYQVFVGLDIRGTPDLSYVPYYLTGTTVAAQGFTYVTKAATTFELALLSPLLINSSPVFTGSQGSSSLVVSARTGGISFFRLDSLSIRFLSSLTSTTQGSTIDPNTSNSLAFYYLVFLLVIPVTMTLLVVKGFKDEK